MNQIILYIIQFAVVLFAISIHEASHGWMADKLGDPTARNQGRITLNPIAHIDPIGTVIFPLMLVIFQQPVFGWAKPVMVNPYNLKNPKKDGMFISAAGPLSNLLVAFIAIIVFLLFRGMVLKSSLLTFFLICLIIINIYLAIFNLIPIPPLDGSGIIEGLLKGQALNNYQKIKPYGFIILIMMIYLGVLNIIATPIEQVVQGILRVRW